MLHAAAANGTFNVNDVISVRLQNIFISTNFHFRVENLDKARDLFVPSDNSRKTVRTHASDINSRKVRSIKLDRKLDHSQYFVDARLSAIRFSSITSSVTV